MASAPGYRDPKGLPGARMWGIAAPAAGAVPQDAVCEAPSGGVISPAATCARCAGIAAVAVPASSITVGSSLGAGKPCPHWPQTRTSSELAALQLGHNIALLLGCHCENGNSLL